MSGVTHSEHGLAETRRKPPVWKVAWFTIAGVDYVLA